MLGITVFDKINSALEELKTVFDLADNESLFNMLKIHFWNCYVRKENNECLLCEMINLTLKSDLRRL